MKLKKTAAAAATLLACGAFALAGCAGNTGSASSSASAGSQRPYEMQQGASTASGLVADIDGMDLDYTDRDKDASYDAETASKVTLNGDTAEVSGDGVVSEGSTVTISAEGTYIVTGALADGQIVVDAQNTDKLQIVLDGASIHNEDGPAIYVKQADKVFVTLADGSTNVLTDGSEYALEEDDEPYATLFSKDDLTINGNGALEVQANYRHGICSKDDLVITGGTYKVNSTEDALRGRDSLKILDGDFTITSGEDSIKSNNDEDNTKGFVAINGGSFNISAGDDAVHGEFAAFVTDGTLDISKSNEGIEAQQIYIDGGTIDLTSSDDALNASSPGDSSSAMGMGGMDANEAGCLIRINGGEITLDASGDGVDSNGSVEINGGVLYVNGPTNSGNGAFDYNGSATVNGGTVIMVGATGMAQSFSSGQQAFISANINGSAGQELQIIDGSGNIIASFTPSKQYGNVVASAPGMTADATYTVKAGASEVSAVATTTGTGAGMGMGGMQGGRGGGQRPTGSGDMGAAPDGSTPPDLPDGEMPGNKEHA